MLHLFFYHIFLNTYSAGVRIAALQNKKAKLWLTGRQNWKKKMQAAMLQANAGTQPTIWMHCASLGEFEQGRPVIEKLKAQNPNIFLVISFFSPSGYEIMKNYTQANLVCYLPLDSPASAKDFLDIVNPTMVLWVKYEYWYYFLKEINSRKIPLLLVSGIFRPNQAFFKWHGTLYRQMLSFFSHLFVQNEDSAILAKRLVPEVKISITGDTRFDRVIDIAEKFTSLSLIETWIGAANKVLVAGSCWDEDDKELTHYVKLHPEIKFIIAPHNINEEEIQDVLQLYPGALRYSMLEAQNIKMTSPSASTDNHVLIIDNVGMLSRLYHYATVTYVGGGFGGDGVHNVLEAAVYGKPVVHGSEYEKFAEAIGLIEAEGSFAVVDALELDKILDRLFTDQLFYSTSAAAAKKFVYNQQGATNKVLDYIYINRLLTK